MSGSGVGLRVSVVMPAAVKTSSREISGFARHLEDVGLDGIFVGDHLAPTTPQVDSTLVLAVAATATERVALGFGVMVVARRGPVWAAKQVATLQTLSAGRLVLGVGAGGDMHGSAAWPAVGVPYAARGPRTDAALRVLPDLITGTQTTLESGTQLQLLPGAPMPPLWIGGMSPAAQRRAATFGDAWFPSMLLATQLPAARSRVRALAEKGGRPEPALALGGAAILGAPQPTTRDAFVRALDGYGVPAEHAEHVPLTGDSSHAADRLAEYKESGVDHLVIGLVGEDWQLQCDLLAQAHASLTARS
jgi:alkanesulfonate monooxygenase SsuD/methylene tetrahydromethanopterin reductase-like flavin-dependent oxidoreductase (luciferase family)